MCASSFWSSSIASDENTAWLLLVPVTNWSSVALPAEGMSCQISIPR